MKKYVCKRMLKLMCHPDTDYGFYGKLKTYIAAESGDVFYETSEINKDGLVHLKGDTGYLGIREETLHEFFDFAGDVKRYICKKSFRIDHYDDNGYYDEKQTVINAGEVFELEETDYRFISGPDSVRLTSGSGNWLEIQKETLEDFFEEV